MDQVMQLLRLHRKTCSLVISVLLHLKVELSTAIKVSFKAYVRYASLVLDLTPYTSNICSIGTHEYFTPRHFKNSFGKDTLCRPLCSLTLHLNEMTSIQRCLGPSYRYLSPKLLLGKKLKILQGGGKQHK